jgi:hypothetical protein
MDNPELGRIILVYQFEETGNNWGNHERLQLFIGKLFRVMSNSQPGMIHLQFCKYKDEKAAGPYVTSDHYWTWYSIANWEYFE